MGQHRRFLSGMSVVLLLAALSGCQRDAEPARIDFDTDPRILRGVWTGESEAGEVLRLEAQAHDPSDSGYLVTGTFTLADAEPVAFSGEVFQPLKLTSGTLRPQTSYPPPFYANSEDGRWRLQGAVSAGLPPRLQVQLSGSATEDFFFMTREADRLPLPEDDDAPITTDQERYTPEDFGDYVRYTVRASYTNTTDESVHLAPCGYEPPSYYLERFDGEAWRVSNFSDACLLVPAPAVEHLEAPSMPPSKSPHTAPRTRSRSSAPTSCRGYTASSSRSLPAWTQVGSPTTTSCPSSSASPTPSS